MIQRKHTHSFHTQGKYFLEKKWLHSQIPGDKTLSEGKKRQGKRRDVLSSELRNITNQKSETKKRQAAVLSFSSFLTRRPAF